MNYKKYKKRNYADLFILLILIITFFVILVLSNSQKMIGLSINNEETQEKVVFITQPIQIINAEHLDSDKNLISNIYDEVKALDDIWSEEIPDTHYVRITFERNLTNENDITIYPRVVSGNPKIEVYEVGGNEIIASFDSLNSNEYNKVYLTRLQGEQDSFDLRVVSGSIEIDYIIDPSTIYDYSTGSGTDKWAYTNANLDAATGAPWTEPSLAPAGEITTAVTTTNLQSYNGAFVKITGSTGDYSPLYLLLTISESPSLITNIDIDVQGIYTETSGTVMQVWVYNFSNPGYYNQIGTDYSMTSTATPGTNFTRTITNGFSDFINANGSIYILFVDGTANKDEYFDYVRVNVTYTDNPPTWQNPSVDDATPNPGDTIKHNVNWTDDTALSYATFEVNSSGANCDTTDNVSSTNLSGYSQWANLTWQIPNACEGKAIGWRQYANDSANQWNTTDLQTYSVQNINPTASFGTNPVANYNSALQSIIFELSCSDNLNVSNLILYGNWTGTWHANQTNASALNDSVWSIQVNGIPEGTGHIWGVWCNDSLNNEDWTDTNRTFAVDITAPSLSDEGSNETEVNQNEVFCLNITASDSLSAISVVYAEVWNTSSWTNYTMSEDGTSCDGTASDGVYGVEIQGTSQGIWNYSRVYANDTLNNWNSYDFTDLTINVTAPADSAYPQFTDFQEAPLNNSNYLFGQTYQFNSTIIFTNGTIYLNFNGTNYSASNVSSEFYVDFGSLSAGTYNYYWWGYGNGSNNNYNSSDTRAYVIAKITPTGSLTNTDLWTITYPEEVTIGLSESNSGDSDVIYEIYRNETNISTGETWTPPAGTYEYILNSSGGENYSANANIDTQMLTINQDSSICGVYFNESSPLIFPSQFEVYTNCSTDYTLYINGTLISNTSTINSGAGYFNFSVQRTDTLNYSHTYMEQFFTVEQNADICGVYFNATSPLTFPDYFIAYTNCSSAYTLMLNGSSISNNSAINGGATAYNISVQRTDTTNYSNIYDEQEFQINKANGEVYAYIDNQQNNKSVLLYNEKWLNATLITGVGDIKLYYNGTLINQGASPLSNLTNFSSEGVWNVSGIYDGNANYTSDIETWWVTVSTDSAPTLTISYPQATAYNTDVTHLDYNVDDDISVSHCWYSLNEGETNSTPDATCSNFIGLTSNEGINTWTAYANDSIGQESSDSVTFSKDTTFPTFSNYLRNPNFPNEDQNVQVNVTITETNRDKIILELDGTTNYTVTTNVSDEYYVTITSGNYTAHDFVTYYWYANDTAGNMNKSSQQSFTVANQAPSVSQPAINDTSPETNDILNCTGGDFSDDDAEDTTESGREFKWYDDDVEISGQTSQTLDLSVNGLDKTDIIKCSIRVSDGYDWSSWVNSSNTATIQNSAPTIDNPQISVTWNANGSTYNYNYEATDLDSDSLTWYDNTTLFDINSETGVISNIPTEAEAGNYTIRIYVSDGTINTTDDFTYIINDVNAPSIEFVSPTENSGVTLVQDYIKINLTSADSNLDTIVIRLYNSTRHLIKTNTSSSSPFNITYQSLSGGIYFYNATANDSYGNEDSTETRNITLYTSTPTLTIHSPENKTYLSNTSIFLNYSVSYEDFVWYNLDQAGDNMTITSSTEFNTTEGAYTLYLYANNTNGLTAENISFTVNLTKFNITYDEFKGSKKGESTNFNRYGYEDLQNLSDVVFENTDYGKISFNEVINVTDDADVSDNELDLDIYINISDNRIEINSTALPNFNKSATLYLYNLTFSNPRILRDGSVCLSTICTKESYSSSTGTLKFNVTQFTIYSAEETPTEEAPSAVPSEVNVGGGGTFKPECLNNTDCEKGEVCWKGICQKLFDVKIIDFESPVKLGDFFDFTYLIKGMADINDDVNVNFWIEKEGKIVTSGSDIIYMENFQEKIETTKIFLPTTTESGIYEFYVEVVHEAYTVKSHRTIEITVKEGVATIKFHELQELKIYALIIIVLLSIIIIFLVIRSLRRKQPLIQDNLYQNLKKRDEELRLQRQTYPEKPKEILVKKRFSINDFLLKIKVTFLRIMYNIKLIFIRLQLYLKKKKKVSKKNKQYFRKKEEKTAEKLIQEINKNDKNKKKFGKDIISDIAKKEKQAGGNL